ncbi:MAG: hypothetical protein HRT87_02780 [Legionellales bacterium]|nr:hypothetical protein [Legionellales bacterium]
MKIVKILGVLSIFFLLSGCDRQKSHQEVIEDLNKIRTKYEQCLVSGMVDKGDIFCKYVLDSPEDFDKLRKLAITEPQKLGAKVLKLQQDVGELKKSSLVEDKEKLQITMRELQKCYLILKLLSSIK